MSDKKASAESIDKPKEVVYDDRQREKFQAKFMKPSYEAQARGTEAQARINGDKELNHKIFSLEELVSAMTIHIDEMRNRLERLEDDAANHESDI